MKSSNYKVGDPVIFKTTKFSAHPGPRAQHIDPAPMGEQYSYEVDKFWVVAAVHDDDTLELRTRRGKIHTIPADDDRLRKPNLWERFVHKSRFPKLPL